jgi:hypothetical protein
MVEQARIKRLHDAPIGPDPPPILQLERTASSGRNLIVVMCGGSYVFFWARLPDSGADCMSTLLFNSGVNMNGPSNHFDLSYEIRTNCTPWLVRA